MHGPLVEITTFRFNSDRKIPPDFHHSPETASRIQLSEAVDNCPFITEPEVTGYTSAEAISKITYPDTV